MWEALEPLLECVRWSNLREVAVAESYRLGVCSDNLTLDVRRQALLWMSHVDRRKALWAVGVWGSKGRVRRKAREP